MTHIESKTKTYCMHGMHSVAPEEMSFRIDHKGHRQRICSNCKNAEIDRIKAAIQKKPNVL